MENRNSLLEYSGEINYQIISGILFDLKCKADSLQTPVGVYKRLMAVTDETLGNILMYSKKTNLENFQFKNFLPQYQFETNGNSFYITVKSSIKEEDKVSLIEQIDKVNGFTRQQLKDYYKKIISNGIFSEQGGAGLGLLIIARSSDNKIVYTFEKINEDWNYFSIIVEISK